MKLCNLLFAGLLSASLATSAQCVNPTTVVCVVGSRTCTLYNAGTLGSYGSYTPGSPTAPVCCGIRMPGYALVGFYGCYIARNLNDRNTTTALDRVAAHNPVFLVACNGDLLPFSAKTFPEREWSAARAVSLSDKKPWGSNGSKGLER